MSKQNIFFDRQRFDALKEWARKNNVTAEISKIRLSRPLLNGVGNYKFNLEDKKMDLVEGDVALNRNDLFVPFAMGLFLIADTNEPTGKAPLLSYPLGANKQMRYFKNVADLEAIYNGQLQIVMNNTTVNASFPCELFRYVPETQPVSMLNSTNQEVSCGLIPEFDIQDAIYPLAPEYYFQGTVNTEISLLFNGRDSNFTVCEPANGADSTTHKARVVLFMLGIKIVNGADSAKDVAKLIRG